MRCTRIIFVYLLVLPAAGILLNSCGSAGSDKEKNAIEFDEANKDLKKSIEEVVYNIPSPSEIPYLIQQTGADFNQSLINPISNAQQYTQRSDKTALNLGIYAADIGYLVSYDKAQEAINYLNACKTLADNLGVVQSFDLEMLKRFEANINNKDSLTALLDKSLKHTERYLQDDRRSRLSALIVAGSFVEGLYISTGLVNTYPKNILPDDKRNIILTPLIQVILNQRKAVSDMVKMLSSIEQPENSSLLKDFQDLEKTYAELNIEEQIRNNRADLMLSDKNLVQISAIVQKIRSEIVR
ncbi:MAG: hypothetical protein N2044_04415 [Cyclobacteriaceae bacterium]|nr:hypothetical protein [Cyclobacteriaceae bacterium]MCX7637073.1 hypothetical protein [Cyclobacteriaceae bacterium]MDW8331534.1 hypothetical protein [Cyclobacteriaceae bacterium]